MRAEISLIMVLIVIFPAAPAWCNGIDPTNSEDIENDTSMPSMELLEFLGGWETDDGEWVDPALLNDTALPDQESSDD